MLSIFAGRLSCTFKSTGVKADADLAVVVVDVVVKAKSGQQKT